MKVAACSWFINGVHSEGEFYEKLAEVINKAADEGAQLLVLPELFILELLSLHKGFSQSEVAQILAGYCHRYSATIRSLAMVAKIGIIAGSHIDENRRNVSLCAWPDGRTSLHPKNVLTQWELSEWSLVAGEGLPCSPNSLVGVTICYDSEFPESGRALAERGVLVQCVPAFTETERGFQRVRGSCLARAIENQVFVVHASLLGDLGTEPVCHTYGSSAIIAPPVEPYPASGILAETRLGEAGLVFADLDFGQLQRARGSGDVRNFEDRARGNWTS